MYERKKLRRLVAVVAVVATMIAGYWGTVGSASAAPLRHVAKIGNDSSSTQSMPLLPNPPKPPRGFPTLRTGYVAPTSLTKGAKGIKAGAKSASNVSNVSNVATTAAVSTPAQAKSWGSTGSATTLVLYDTTNTYGWLGELYAIGAGNLATHFGKVTAEPVVDYVSGQVNSYTSTIYIGSTYNEPIPATFLNDVLASTHPVIWAADNIWQLSGASGSATDLAFEATYGWDPSTSYFDTTDNPLTVTYKGTTFTRNADNGAVVLAPHIITPSAVTVVASANCTDSTGAPVACAPIAQTTGTSFPWTIRSGNLTYVGEIPLSYMNETDRYLIFADLLFNSDAPTTTPIHQALVRLEDVGADDDPTSIRQIADYLSSVHVPFSIAVIPDYIDPTGVYNNGVPVNETIAQDPQMISALKYAKSKGATIMEEGYTHQYSTIANPYDGVSGDDAEFYRAQCSTTQTPPYNFEAPCQNTDWVIWTGPLPGDSTAWAAGRAKTGQSIVSSAGLGKPTLWLTPHYFASAADYAGIDQSFPMRYDRDLFVSGLLSGQPLNYTRIFGQFFPYTVTDIYGEKIIPENLGDFEPTAVNNNPPRTAADLVSEAQLNLAVTSSTASFFFDPNNPLTDLEQSVSGMQALGYTFVSPTAMK